MTLKTLKNLRNVQTTVDGKRVKDDGILEHLEVSLEEARNLVMSARLKLGWINQDEFEKEIKIENNEINND